MEIREIRELTPEQYYDEAVQNYEDVKANTEFVEAELERLSEELDWRVMDVMRAGMQSVYEALENFRQHVETLEQQDEVKKILEERSKN